MAERLSRSLGPTYEVRRLVGEGGFAQVWEVWDGELERRLAVKVLKPDIAWSAGMLERFKQECRAIARLDHPNILPIHFVGTGEGIVFYAMPFVEGESLAALLRRESPLPLDRALGILRPILEALAHAHAQGLVHRDIKPDNIMLQASTGRPLLVDFGIAKQLGGAGHKTQTGFVVGTPQYMSPEQALGQGDLDARSDLYAIGAVLFQMVTGAPPFEGDTSQEIVGKHLSEPAPIATARNARIPMWLSEVIVRCLAKRPAERFQSAAALLEALQAGPASGSEEAVSAERVARRVQEQATVRLPSAERPASSSAPPPSGGPGGAARARASRRWATAAVVVGLGAGAVLWFQRGASAELVVENRLVEPIRLVVGGRTTEIPAGGRAAAPVTARETLVAQWYLVRPEGPGGRPLGIELQGTIAADRPRGRMVRVISAESGEHPVFAPLITNAAGVPLEVTVNAGLAGAEPCQCAVPPGATRAHLGYYRLYRNSTVEARDPTGARARFQDLGSQVDRGSGVVGLRFRAGDFRAR
jgi:serine/threonine-protein kinase